MSPLKYHESDVTKGVMNGPRSLPLRISKDSHVIHKPPPPGQSAAAAKRQPVIIYTHSPKVIHTQPNDFMTLVQKLTGMSRDDADADAAVLVKAAAREEDKDNNVINNESSETASSVLVKRDSAPMYKMSAAFLVEAPLFTPSSSEFFCSPRPNPMFHQSPGMAVTSISPSFMDYIKAFPDY